MKVTLHRPIVTTHYIHGVTIDAPSGAISVSVSRDDVAYADGKEDKGKFYSTNPILVYGAQTALLIEATLKELNRHEINRSVGTTISGEYEI